MKFDENCQRRIIRDLQRNRGVELRKVGAARKYLVDDRGVRYIVLGGADYGHEIPRSIFEAEERASGNTLLVIAMLDGNSLDIFTGPFRPLLEHKNRLRIDKDNYVFHVHRFTARLLVREVPWLELTQMGQRIPEERKGATGKVPTKRTPPQTIPVATVKQPNPAKETQTSGRGGVIAADGKLIRVDFRRKEVK